MSTHATDPDAAGAITPGAAALLHNLVTLGAGAFSLTPLLPSPLPAMEEDA